MHFVLACGSESKYVLQIKAYRFRASSCDFTFGNVQLNLSVRIKKVHAKYKECLMALTQHCRSLLLSKYLRHYHVDLIVELQIEK